MTIATLPHRLAATPPEPSVLRSTQELFRQSMRQLAGGISVITVGEGDERTGLTATSVTSLSAEPPTLIVCVNLSSSSWPVLEREGRFGVNFLGTRHREVAERFSGRGGIKGAQRYEGAEWETLVTGAPILKGSLSSLDCEVEEIIIKHSHAIVIGGVAAVHVGDATSPLVYWRGAYGDFQARDADRS